VEIRIDSVGDDADRVGWLLVEINANFFIDIVGDIVGRVTGDDSCGK
jgi:hypothetical protein